jgi:hypothetical protein
MSMARQRDSQPFQNSRRARGQRTALFWPVGPSRRYQSDSTNEWHGHQTYEMRSGTSEDGSVRHQSQGHFHSTPIPSSSRLPLRISPARESPSRLALRGSPFRSPDI